MKIQNCEQHHRGGLCKGEIHAQVKRRESGDAVVTKDGKDEKLEGGAHGFRVEAQR